MGRNQKTSKEKEPVEEQAPTPPEELQEEEYSVEKVIDRR